MRLIIFLLILLLAVAQSINFTSFERSVKRLAGSSFGELNRTALTQVFKEEATKAETSLQDLVDTCSECIQKYGAIREEFISNGVEGALILGQIVKDSNSKLMKLYDAHDAKENATELELQEKLQKRSERFMQLCGEYLPKTVEFINSKIKQMKQSNSSDSVISFVRLSFEKILNANAVEKGLKPPSDTYYGATRFVQGTYDAILAEHQKLSDHDRALVNKFFCADILYKKILSVDGTALDLYEKLTEGVLAKSLNFTELIVNLELSSHFEGPIGQLTLETHFVNSAYFSNVSVREHFKVCMDNIIGYRNMSDEHRKISEENRSNVIRVLNKTDRHFEDLAQFLPVTFEFAAPKLTALKQWTLANNTIDVIESVLFHIVEEHVVKRTFDMSWMSEEMMKEKGWDLHYEQHQIIGRYFCFSYINLLLTVNDSMQQ